MKQFNSLNMKKETRSHYETNDTFNYDDSTKLTSLFRIEISFFSRQFSVSPLRCYMYSSFNAETHEIFRNRTTTQSFA